MSDDPYEIKPRWMAAFVRWTNSPPVMAATHLMMAIAATWTLAGAAHYGGWWWRSIAATAIITIAYARLKADLAEHQRIRKHLSRLLADAFTRSERR